MQCSQEWDFRGPDTVCVFHDRSRNKSSGLVSLGSNVVSMLWGLLVMQSRINGDCQWDHFKQCSIYRHTGADGPDGSESLSYSKTTPSSASSSFSWEKLWKPETWSKVCSKNIVWFRWPSRLVFFLSWSHLFLKLQALSALNHVFQGIVTTTEGRMGCI